MKTEYSAMLEYSATQNLENFFKKKKYDDSAYQECIDAVNEQIDELKATSTMPRGFHLGHINAAVKDQEKFNNDLVRLFRLGLANSIRIMDRQNMDIMVQECLMWQLALLSSFMGGSAHLLPGKEDIPTDPETIMKTVSELKIDFSRAQDVMINAFNILCQHYNLDQRVSGIMLTVCDKEEFNQVHGVKEDD